MKDLYLMEEIAVMTGFALNTVRGHRKKGLIGWDGNLRPRKRGEKGKLQLLFSRDAIESYAVKVGLGRVNWDAAQPVVQKPFGQRPQPVDIVQLRRRRMEIMEARLLAREQARDSAPHQWTRMRPYVAPKTTWEMF